MNSNYTNEYIKTIEFLLQLLKDDIKNRNKVEHYKQYPENRIPIYISLLDIIEEMRGGFLVTRPKIIDGIGQNYLYSLNNEAMGIVSNEIAMVKDNNKFTEMIQAIENKIGKVVKAG